MPDNGQIIAQTQKWITDVVIGLNFCPFAAKEVKQNKVYYRVENNADIKTVIEAFLQECVRLDEHEKIETTLLILPDSFANFDDYLKLITLAEKALKKKGYEGVYQVASFHPKYCFAGSDDNDAANYTNRSVYPMLHLLREESIDAALARYETPEDIPERNIKFTREKGIAYMKMLRDSCL